MSHRAYADIETGGGRIQTHFREAGSGPVLLALHPSPLSSKFLGPVIDRAAAHFHVLAPDTPGYGQSDPLPEPAETLAPYVEWLGEFMHSTGLQSAVLYGSATGAQIAIEFAKAHPQRTRALLLENAVHFSDAETEDILQHYFPDISPRADGRHLELAWTMADALFRGFPWYENVPGDAPSDRNVAADPPLELVHATAMAYLQAGSEYALAYRAAFRNERAERLAAVTVPTWVVRWAGGMLNEQARRLDAFDWPDHITMAHCGVSPEARFALLESLFKQLAVQPPSTR